MTKKNLKLYLNNKGEGVKSIQHIERRIRSIDGLNDKYLVTFTPSKTRYKGIHDDIHVWEEDVKKFLFIYLREKKLERLVITESEE